MRFFLFLIIFLLNYSLYAQSIPRYVSLKSEQANLRVGPSKDYPIILQYTYPTMPLKVIGEYEKWRKVIDIEKNEGWIFVNLLSSKRFGIINPKENSIKVFKKPNDKIIGEIGKGNIVKLNKCMNNWCKIKIQSYNGWVKSKFIWGVFDNENFK